MHTSTYPHSSISSLYTKAMPGPLMGTSDILRLLEISAEYTITFKTQFWLGGTGIQGL